MPEASVRLSWATPTSGIPRITSGVMIVTIGVSCSMRSLEYTGMVHDGEAHALYAASSQGHVAARARRRRAGSCVCHHGSSALIRVAASPPGSPKSRIVMPRAGQESCTTSICHVSTPVTLVTTM